MSNGTFSWMTGKNIGGQFLIAQSYIWYLMQVQKKDRGIVNKDKKLSYMYSPPTHTGLSTSIASDIFYKEHQYFAISTHITLLKFSLGLPYFFGFVLTQNTFIPSKPYIEFINI